MAMKRSTSLKETDHIARNLLQALFPKEDAATVVALKGDLGSGKTTFVQMVANAYGVKEQVTSPTFVIEKIYKLEGRPFDRLIHIDAYRLESAHELEVLGWNEIVSDPKNLILIEWPERVPGALPEDGTTVAFTFIDEVTRDIDISYGDTK